MLSRKSRRSFIPRGIIYTFLASLLALTLIQPVLAAETDDTKDKEILYYNPTCSAGSSGELTGPEPTALKGKDNPEKVWNYLMERGLTPIAAAGVMGNMQAESGFRPFVENDIGAFGIVQWLGGRAATIKAKLTAGGVTSYTDENNDKALLIELNHMWIEGGLPLPMAEFWPKLNAETKVDGDTSIDGSQWDSWSRNIGNGSILLFHAFFERSSNEGITNRMTAGKNFIELFSGGGGSQSAGGCSSGGTTDIVELAKKVKPGIIGAQMMGGLKGGISGLDCSDCVMFVTTVYVGAGYPAPFGPVHPDKVGISSVPKFTGGRGTTTGGYFYDSGNYEEIPNSQKQPGDILVWSGHVAIYAGGVNVFEGGLRGGGPVSSDGSCNIDGPEWPPRTVENATILRYKGPAL